MICSLCGRNPEVSCWYQFGGIVNLEPCVMALPYPDCWDYISEKGMGMKTASELTGKRNETHGNFADNALISQDLKSYFRTQGAKELSAVQREALDMIALKLSRILSGKADEPDHWRDIAGYAWLVVQDLEPSK